MVNPMNATRSRPSHNPVPLAARTRSGRAPAPRPERRWAVSLSALLLMPLLASCTGAIGSPGAGSSGTGNTGGPSGSGGTGMGAGPDAGADANTGTGGGTGSGSGGTGGPGGGGSGGGATPGMPVIANKAIHRLSNVEYDNTIRDLLHTDPGFGKGFGSEETDGFDNIATGLSMSPRQVEDYFTAARTVAATVFADATLRGRIVTCDPAADTTCPQKVITTFGRRAFRRPLDSAETSSLLAKYQEARTLGVDAMGALQHVVHVMLVSPQFLYRIEFDPDVANVTPHAVSSYELASRLSYALWSSMPDDTLLASADSGDLSQPSTLLTQVDRMLGDSRSDMLVKNFAAQWFGSRRLADHAVSSTIFPTWTTALGASMQQEMELYFSEFLHGDMPFSEFLTADVNFVDANLATFYGMAKPSGTGFQRVVDTSDHRRGFLSLAGFLTHTSRETRTSPIIRGKWILDSVWCVALRLPTNLVIEPLPEPQPGDAPTTIREQMALHRQSAVCAACHDTIDPIGLSLEHFDGIGQYRGLYDNGLAIDTVGTLPGGTMVDGLDSLSTVLASDPRFMSCATLKFGTYAMGLLMDNANRDQVLARWMSGTPTLKNLIKETVSSEMFRMRKAEGQ